MSSAEESPAQKAARLRRERREAKIKAGGSARLDKITSLSGRTPTSGTSSRSDMVYIYVCVFRYDLDELMVYNSARTRSFVFVSTGITDW